ncbi:MAG: hypothetical protein RIT43_7 [Bacteroidota bacterium]
MKNILSISAILLLTSITFAQDAADRKVQAGLILGSGLSFQDVRNTVYFENNGAGTDLSIGMNLNFNFSETIGFCTGTEFDFSNVRLKSTQNIYYHYNGNDVLQLRDKNDYDNNSESYSTFMLEERRDKSVYLSIPTMLLFRTKFIGYFRYFGKFGLRNSFLLKTESFDSGKDFGTQPLNVLPTPDVDKDNMATKGNAFFYKGAIGMAAGAEWNFSGSTSLVGELGYYYGITPLYWERDSDSDKLSLFATGANNGSGNDIYTPIKARQGQLMLKISILF